MFYGTIKRLEPARGFGFIETGGRDVYFHAADIGAELFQRLTVFQPVMFEYAPREKDVKPEERKGPRAVKLQLIERIPGGILERTPQELAPKHHPKARQRKATWKRRIDVRQSDNDGSKGPNGA